MFNKLLVTVDVESGGQLVVEAVLEFVLDPTQITGNAWLLTLTYNACGVTALAALLAVEATDDVDNCVTLVDDALLVEVVTVVVQLPLEYGSVHKRFGSEL